MVLVFVRNDGMEKQNSEVNEVQNVVRVVCRLNDISSSIEEVKISVIRGSEEGVRFDLENEVNDFLAFDI